MPAEGSLLNYRLAGFSVPTKPGASVYSFEIANGHQTNEKAFAGSFVTTQNSKENKTIILLPKFGQRYTWRVVYKDKDNKTKGKSPFYHFATDTICYVDTARYRLRIIDTATAFKDMLVLPDCRVMYDMKGNPVWFLPDLGEQMPLIAMPRDFKPTADGTFTFLKDNDAFEIDYNGKILWQAPRGVVHKDSQEAYHHDFTKLANGHYMIADQEVLTLEDSNKAPYPVTCGTLVEFDSAGKLIWQWKSSNYFINNANYKAHDGRFYIYPHLNAFYFDDPNKVIYLSFRNTNNILKIAYPSGHVIADYEQKDNPLFEAQHSCRIAGNGDLYLFNNNASKNKNPLNAISYIARFEEPADGSNQLKKLWEYSCKIDAEARSCSLSGGSVYELKDGSMLSCMGMEGRVFIVSPDQKLIWNALPEQRPQGEWRVWQQYRASFIENAAMLDKFIFR